MRALGRWLVAGLVLLLARRPAPRRRERSRRVLPEAPPSPAAELVVLLLLAVAATLAVAFVVAYALEGSTQAFGLTIGGALAALSAAAIVAAHRLVPEEQRVELHPEHANEAAVAETEQLLEDAGSRISRRRLLRVATLGTAATVGGALVVPALSLGPAFVTGDLRRSPWRRGRRLVDERGRFIRVDQLEVGTYLPAFPQGADPHRGDAPLALVRIREDELDLPSERSDWAPEGILAYSSICTHAACAVTLFRYPLFQPTSPEPALVCPCHYSTFAVGRGGDVVFGPAGRPLPQLPLAIGDDGTLEAAGPLSGRAGPSWWGVRS